MGGWGRDIDGKFLSEEKRNDRFCLGAETFNRSRKPKKRLIVLCCSSMSVASGEGTLWETAVAILMLRHSMMTGTLNCPETERLGAIRGLGDLGIYSETNKRSGR